MMQRNNSWPESGPAVEFHLGFSAALCGFALLLHGLVAFLIFVLTGAGWAGLCLLTLAAASLVCWLPLAGPALSRQGLAMVRWHEDHSWTLSDCAGRARLGWLAGSTVFAPHILLLRWRREDGRVVFAVLLPGAGDAVQFRRLRARLRTADTA